MLVLSRREGESIRIGENGEIEIQIVDVTRGQVKIGIKAPSNIPVHREEIFEKILKEKAAKANA